MVARPVFAPLTIEAEQPSHEAWTAWSACSRGRSAGDASTRWCSRAEWAFGRPSSSTSRTPFAGLPRAPRRARPRLPARRPDVPGLDARAPRANRGPLVPDDGRRRVHPPGRRRRRGRGPGRRAAGVREGPRGAGDRRRRDPRPAPPIAETLEVAAEPSVMPLRFVQHLATEITGTLPERAACCRSPGSCTRRPRSAASRATSRSRWSTSTRASTAAGMPGPIGWLGARRRRRAVRRPALRHRRSHAGHAVRGLRHRRRLGPGRRVGGVADEAARGRVGAGRPGGRAMTP